MLEQILTISGSIASILGLLIAIFTLVIVTRLRTAIKRYSRHRQLTEIIDRVVKIPATKEVLPDSTCSEIRFVIDTVRDFDLSFWYWFDRPAKKVASKIETELNGSKRRQILQNNLKLLRDEITVR